MHLQFPSHSVHLRRPLPPSPFREPLRHNKPVDILEIESDDRRRWVDPRLLTIDQVLLSLLFEPPQHLPALETRSTAEGGVTNC